MIALVFNLLFAATTVNLKPAGTTLRIVVVGDAGASPDKVGDAILALHKQQPIDAILYLGDNFYECGVTSTTDPQWKRVNHFSAVGVPIFAVLGNHDYGKAKDNGTVLPCKNQNPNPQAEVDATGTIKNWQMPSRSYTIDAKLATFYMTDTTPVAEGFTVSVLGGKTGGVILQELKDALATASTTPWRIVAGHHIIFSSGNEHGAPCDSGCKRMRSDMLPLLKSGHVDVYVSGHDHDVELIGPSDLWYLVSGAGSPPKIRTYKKRPASEPPTVFPKTIPSNAFAGFALLELSQHEAAVTIFGINGAKSDRVVLGTK